mmetsp:Transcript_63295/g.119865  ORF Transcript_63295/g.119865 Transcript_63295/m.119865 type:complete len:523 (-) Transcript_63295:255-1823(-)
MIWPQAFLLSFFLVLSKAWKPHGHVSEKHNLRHNGAASDFDVEKAKPTFFQIGSSMLQQDMDMTRSDAALDQPAEDVEVTEESFLSRMQDACVDLLLGIVLILFSVPLLWYNEKRSAVYETLVDRCEKDVRVLARGSAPEEKNNNWPVLVSGEQMHAVTPVKHPQFNLKYEKGCICIRSSVSVYQWVENTKTEEREKLGGGKETRTTYYYEKKWSQSFNDGSTFRTSGYRNTKPVDLTVGTETVWASRIEFGNGFVLSHDLRNQCTGGEAPKNVQAVVMESSNQKFVRAGDSFYTGNSSSPEIGDASVTFTIVLDDIATVLALQATTEDGCTSFLPYRVIRRPCCPCCPLTEEQEKETLLEAGMRTSSDLATQDIWGGILWCCCWPCNLIAMCVAVVATPELNMLMKGSLGKRDVFKAVRDRAVIAKWLGRFTGWILMFVGLNMCFTPFTTFIKIIPFLGPLLSKLSSGVIFACSLLVTVIVSMLIVGIAYSLYHPLVGLLYFAVVGGLIVGIMVLSELLVH